MIKNRLFLIGGVACLALSACGEKPQTVAASPGQSAAKPDDKPYQNEQFKNDRDAWQRTMRARADNQNEYKRVN
jgi:outer membrane biogenesis lipoprotein LolB